MSNITPLPNAIARIYCQRFLSKSYGFSSNIYEKPLYFPVGLDKVFFKCFYFFFCRKKKSFFILPNSTTAHIEVLCSDGANDGANGGVFINLHGVERLAEDRRLLHVQHADLHGGRVFEGARGVKPVVKVKVGGFHFKSIRLLCFKIQWLSQGETKREEVHSHRRLRDGEQGFRSFASEYKLY